MATVICRANESRVRSFEPAKMHIRPLQELRHLGEELLRVVVDPECFDLDSSALAEQLNNTQHGDKARVDITTQKDEVIVETENTLEVRDFPNHGFGLQIIKAALGNDFYIGVKDDIVQTRATFRPHQQQDMTVARINPDF